MKYKSTKLFNGYSTAFRQWRAASHCQFVHGYALEFKVTFEGDLDECNWVLDFGCFKTNGIKAMLSEQFDHTFIVSKDDPHLFSFRELNDIAVIQLRVVENVGCEAFAKWVYDEISRKLSSDKRQKQQRVRVAKVECFEGGTKNSAIYEGSICER